MPRPRFPGFRRNRAVCRSYAAARRPAPSRTFSAARQFIAKWRACGRRPAYFGRARGAWRGSAIVRSTGTITLLAGRLLYEMIEHNGRSLEMTHRDSIDSESIVVRFAGD